MSWRSRSFYGDTSEPSRKSVVGQVFRLLVGLVVLAVVISILRIVFG